MVSVRLSVKSVRVDEAKLAGAVTPMLARTHRRLTARGVDIARELAPVRTGRIANSNGVLPMVVRPMHVSGGLKNDTPYALFVHEPTRPHVIAARNARYLSFIWHGRRVFFKKVNHPGTPGQPWLRAAALAAGYETVG